MAELNNRRDIETAFANRLAALDLRHRQIVFSMAGFPPDLDRVPEQVWRQIEDEQKREIAAIVLIIAASSARQHALPLGISYRAAQAYAVARADVVLGGAKAKFAEFKTASQVVDELTRFAVTETTAAQTAGSEAAAAIYGMDEADLWITENDGRVCPTCGPLHMATRKKWMARFPNGTPAHPNCRCYISYAFERVRGLRPGIEYATT